MGHKIRQRKNRDTEKGAPLFHMAIGVAPETKPASTSAYLQQISLEKEIKLIKAALLYSDTATLYSMSTSMLSLMLSLKTLTTKQKIYFLGSVAPQLVKESNRESLVRNLPVLYQLIEKRNELKPDQLLFLINIENQIETMWEPMIELFESYAVDAGAGEIETAINAGLLNIHVLGLQKDETFKFAQMNDIINKRKPESILVEYINAITRIVVEGDAYPLFDDMTGDFIGSLIKEERIDVSESRTARGKNSVLATRLLERLPLFEEASMDEIIDIRAELDRPLINFRRAIIDFSKDMKTAAWNKDFPIEADQVFYQKVAPAILEIEEKVKQTKSLSDFLIRLANRPVAASTLSVLISQAMELPGLASTALTIGGMIASGAASILEYKSVLKSRKDIEQNQLFFYYRAGKLLANQ